MSACQDYQKIIKKIKPKTINKEWLLKKEIGHEWKKRWDVLKVLPFYNNFIIFYLYIENKVIIYNFLNIFTALLLLAEFTLMMMWHSSQCNIINFLTYFTNLQSLPKLILELY